MTRDDLLTALFPEGHDLDVSDGLITGTAPWDGRQATVAGFDGAAHFGMEGAMRLSRTVLDAIRTGDGAPILLPVDAGPQRRRGRAELLSLNAGLSHLAKSLRRAERSGHATAAVLHGPSAAAAFVAAGLGVRCIVGLPGADPTVLEQPWGTPTATLQCVRSEGRVAHAPARAVSGAERGAVRACLDPAMALRPQIAQILDALPEAAVRRPVMPAEAVA